jgi:3-hydroxyisobutyrate dehydrogenase-like beta-hydroxyacid dehydrogenase
VNNSLLAANLLLAAEGLNKLACLGVDLGKAAAVIGRSSGGSTVMADRVPLYVLNDKNVYGFSLEGLVKDIKNGDWSKSDEPLLFETLRLAERRLTECGEANEDHTVLCKLLTSK